MAETDQIKHKKGKKITTGVLMTLGFAGIIGGVVYGAVSTAQATWQLTAKTNKTSTNNSNSTKNSNSNSNSSKTTNSSSSTPKTNPKQTQALTIKSVAIKPSTNNVELTNVQQQNGNLLTLTITPTFNNAVTNNTEANSVFQAWLQKWSQNLTFKITNPFQTAFNQTIGSLNVNLSTLANPTISNLTATYTISISALNTLIQKQVPTFSFFANKTLTCSLNSGNWSTNFTITNNLQNNGAVTLNLQACTFDLASTTQAFDNGTINYLPVSVLQTQNPSLTIKLPTVQTQSAFAQLEQQYWTMLSNNIFQTHSTLSNAYVVSKTMTETPTTNPLTLFAPTIVSNAAYFTMANQLTNYSEIVFNYNVVNLKQALETMATKAHIILTFVHEITFTMSWIVQKTTNNVTKSLTINTTQTTANLQNNAESLATTLFFSTNILANNNPIVQTITLSNYFNKNSQLSKNLNVMVLGNVETANGTYKIAQQWYPVNDLTFTLNTQGTLTIGIENLGLWLASQNGNITYNGATFNTNITNLSLWFNINSLLLVIQNVYDGLTHSNAVFSNLVPWFTLTNTNF